MRISCLINLLVQPTVCQRQSPDSAAVQPEAMWALGHEAIRRNAPHLQEASLTLGMQTTNAACPRIKGSLCLISV